MPELRVGAEPAPCAEHCWEPVETPIDSARQWYRCRVCRAYGSGRRRFKIFGTRTPGRRPIAPKIEAYRCSVEGCSEVAVERVPGRGPRCSYIWRCEGHR